MSEMVERIAKAMFQHANPHLDPDFILAGNTDPDWKIFEWHARVAIAAMREPTEDMIESGFIKPPQWDHDSATVLDVWQCMIDEALK